MNRNLAKNLRDPLLPRENKTDKTLPRALSATKTLRAFSAFAPNIFRKYKALIHDVIMSENERKLLNNVRHGPA